MDQNKQFLSLTGFTLVEMMLVILIFAFLFSAVLVVMTTSDRSWRVGYNKLVEQQEARRVMDNIAWLLRQSSPDWVIDGVHYPVAIIPNERIDFYQPIFTDGGEVSTLRKITFKVDPANSSQLLKKEGLLDPIVITNNLASVNFGGACPDCSIFICTSVANLCPIVNVEIKTKTNTEFLLASKITLRNANAALDPDVVVEEPEAGEF